MKITVKTIGGSVKIEGDFSSLAEALRSKITDLRGANLRGANLCDADLRGADLCDANLCDANLRDANLRDANLCDANLCGANLRGANLRGANLCGADLRGANLRDANLCDANLCGAKTAFVQPMLDLDKRILEAVTTSGKLEMGNWHTCETTHCRAGWAITIHPSGKTLESIFGSNVAGALIYNASYPKMKVPNFFASNDEALADIKARAAL